MEEGGAAGAVRMEADSTTCGARGGAALAQCPGNVELFNSNINSKSENGTLVPWLQNFGLIRSQMRCEKCAQTMCVRPARVSDKVHWHCEGCKQQCPIRTESFFLNIYCSFSVALKIILAWCEDMDHAAVAQYLGVKVRETNTVYNRLDGIAAQEGRKQLLGGEGSAVLLELYPACVENRLPDSSDQLRHQHQILMLHDTKHVPTRFRFHVMQTKINKTENSIISGKKSKNEKRCGSKKETWREEIISFCAEACERDSELVTGLCVPEFTSPQFRSVTSIHQVLRHTDDDTRNFYCSRIWKQAVKLCAAAHDICPMVSARNSCTVAVQKYLDASAYRLARDMDGFYEHILRVIASRYSEPID